MARSSRPASTIQPSANDVTSPSGSKSARGTSEPRVLLAAALLLLIAWLVAMWFPLGELKHVLLLTGLMLLLLAVLKAREAAMRSEPPVESGKP